MTSWTDDGRIPPHVSLLESAAYRKFLKRALGFCVMLNTTFLMILELNAHFLSLLGCRTLSVESER